MTEWKKSLLERYAPSVWPHIECGDGWRPLVEYLYDEVDKHPCISVAQVKEKFGCLRFYLDHDCECEACVDDDSALRRLERKTDIIEDLSGYICELCGAPGKVVPVRPGAHYIRSLCEGCGG